SPAQTGTPAPRHARPATSDTETRGASKPARRAHDRWRRWLSWCSLSIETVRVRVAGSIHVQERGRVEQRVAIAGQCPFTRLGGILALRNQVIAPGCGQFF